MGGGVFFWWLEPSFFFWCWEKSYCFLPNFLELDDGVGTSIGFASDLLWYMQGNKRYFWKHVKQWLGWCLKVKISFNAKTSWKLLKNPAKTKGNNVPHHNIKKDTKLDTEHQWNYGADWKVNWSQAYSWELVFFWNVNNSKFNHRSTEISLSNFAMSQLLEVYEYFPPTKTTTDGLPENHHRNGKETHLIQTSNFFLGEKGP